MAKKLFVILIVVFGAIGLISVFTYFNTYNSLVTLDVEVDAQWANVESAYQRRADLIPNLVATVKGAAEFESSTLTEVIEARSKATSINLDASNLNESNLRNFQAAQDELSGALSKLLVSVERYPELKATANFAQLQNQLEQTENRINVERNRFNATVKEYDAKVRRFPGAIVAGFSGMDVKGTYFQADAGSESAPAVEF